MARKLNWTLVNSHSRLTLPLQHTKLLALDVSIQSKTQEQLVSLKGLFYMFSSAHSQLSSITIDPTMLTILSNTNNQYDYTVIALYLS